MGGKLIVLKLKKGGAGNSITEVVAETIENNIFNNIWISNITIITIIILILILKKRNLLKK